MFIEINNGRAFHKTLGNATLMTKSYKHTNYMKNIRLSFSGRYSIIWQTMECYNYMLKQLSAQCAE